jgi:MYXO-CTERM domain-containing protein
MAVNRRNSGPLLATATLAALVAAAAPAGATGPAVLKIAPGVGGGEGEYGGPGNEQPALTAFEKNGKRYVVLAYMSSDVDDGLGPWQCKCTSLELSPTTAPTVVADQVYLTQNQNSDRPCNHPAIITDGEYAIWTWGYAKNGGSTETYAQVLDETCQPVTDVVRISNNDGNNNGAPDLLDAGDGYLSIGYYSNGDQRTYVRGVSLQKGGGVELEPTYRTTVVTPSNIGRPTMVTASEDRALVCAAKGDNRPPEDGVECAYYNPRDGELYWREVIAASQPNDHIYMNQPSVTKLGPGRFALHVIESTGQGKNTNVKGGSRSHVYILQPNDETAGVKAHAEAVGVYQTHSSIFAGRYGDKGDTYLGIYEAAITGSGVPAITFASYDSAAQQITIDAAADQWVVGPTNADSGYLANLYGANPGKQGRDFMRGIADVPNPGDGVAGGFMSEVKTFWVLPYAGMDGTEGEYKNALYLSFVPGQTNIPVENETPTVVTPGEPATPDPSASATTSASTTTSATSGAGAGPSATDDGSLGPTASSGCACEAGGRGAPRGSIAALVALALGLVLRRKKS